MRLRAALFFLACAALPAFSMDTQLTVLGFSRDGSYIAFRETGIDPVAGNGFSRVFIVDVVANDYAMPPYDMHTFADDLEVDSDTRQLNQMIMDDVRDSLLQYAIVEGNTGELVYERQGHLPADEAMSTHKTLEFRVLLDDLYINHTLVLDEREVASTRCSENALRGTPPRIFSLSVFAPVQEIPLQNDTVLYASRHCPYAYEISRVYVYGDKLAVFLASHTYGIDGGTDYYRLIVTGVLNRTYPETVLKEDADALPSTTEPQPPGWAAGLPHRDPFGEIPASMTRPLQRIESERAFALETNNGNAFAVRFYFDGVEQPLLAGRADSFWTPNVMDASALGERTYHYRAEAYIIPTGSERGVYTVSEGEVNLAGSRWDYIIYIRDDGNVFFFDTPG